MTPFAIDRRSLFKGTGALVVSLGLPGGMAEAEIGSAIKPPLAPGQLDSWLAIKSDGAVVAYFGKMDMGQGVDVAIAQIVAEELDVPFERVNVVMGDTSWTVNQGGASGSTGIQKGGIPLRNAAAEFTCCNLPGAGCGLDRASGRCSTMRSFIPPTSIWRPSSLPVALYLASVAPRTVAQLPFRPSGSTISARRWPTGRCGTAAPSAARSRTPTRPVTCRRWPWPSTPSS